MLRFGRQRWFVIKAWGPGPKVKCSCNHSTRGSRQNHWDFPVLVSVQGQREDLSQGNNTLVWVHIHSHTLHAHTRYTLVHTIHSHIHTTHTYTHSHTLTHAIHSHIHTCTHTTHTCTHNTDTCTHTHTTHSYTLTNSHTDFIYSTHIHTPYTHIHYTLTHTYTHTTHTLHIDIDIHTQPTAIYTHSTHTLTNTQAITCKFDYGPYYVSEADIPPWPREVIVFWVKPCCPSEFHFTSWVPALLLTKGWVSTEEDGNTHFPPCLSSHAVPVIPIPYSTFLSAWGAEETWLFSVTQTNSCT